MVVKLFQNFTSNKIFLCFVYFFVLFAPSAFDKDIGTRLYRNSIIAPFTLILFALMLSVIFKLLFSQNVSWKYLLASNVAIAFVFTFTSYIKEDGIWLLACVAFYALLCSLIVVFQYLKTNRKKGLQIFVFSLVPLLLFSLGTHFYKSINLRYFGVYAINTRTEGELGGFVSNVYKIKSDDRSWQCWAPHDAIEKAFDASPTLREYTVLRERVLNNGWVGQNPIPGDFLTWVLRRSLWETGMWGVGDQLEPVTFVSAPPDTERMINDLFRKVNLELKQAFADGTLERASGFQLSSSAPGKTLGEMLSLTKFVLSGYNEYIFLGGFEPGGIVADYPTIVSQKPFQYASVLTNMDLGNFSDPAAIHYQRTRLSLGNKIASGVFNVYRVLNPLLWIVAFVAFVLPKRCYADSAKKVYSIKFCMLVLLGICTVYLFGICWFSEFLIFNHPPDRVTYVLKYYGVGAVPLMSLFQLFGFYLLLTTNYFNEGIALFSKIKTRRGGWPRT